MEVSALRRQLSDRVRGAFYGFAIGDAMGATTEFMNAEQIKKEYGVLNELVGGGWLHLKPGQVTDDTQMMICVMRAVVVCGEIRVDGDTLWRIADNFLAWYKSNPPDVGGTCAKRLSLLDSYDKVRGHVTSKTVRTMLNMRNNEGLGNGALMRAVPFGLLGNVEMNRRQGKLTHNNQESTRAVTSYSKALYLALLTGKLPKQPTRLLEPSGRVRNTYNNAIYYAGRGYKRGVIATVNRGGDADTIAALTGGLAGAAFGLSSVPERWIEQLDPLVCEEIEKFSKCACKFLNGVL